jgi:hypothetical protein
MTARTPPVPPASQSPKGPAGEKGTAAESRPDTDTRSDADPRDRNLREQGRQGNIKQNTTHQGYQQDR